MALLAAFAVPHPPLIVPEIGGGAELQIQKTIDAYREVARRIAAHQPETIIVTTPHSVLYGDYIHISPGKGAEGSFAQFDAPEVKFKVEYDEELVSVLTALAEAQGIPAGTEGEINPGLDHATLVPLYFIDQEQLKPRLVRISLSGLSPLEHYRFGQLIRKAAESCNRRIVLVASGDLSHRLKEEGPYGFAKEGPDFDRQVTEALAVGDFARLLAFDENFCEAAGECGLRSFIIMAGALDGLAVRSELLSYEGPFGVGYAVAAFEPEGPDDGRRFGAAYESAQLEEAGRRKVGEDVYVRLARASLEHWLEKGSYLPLPSGLPTELTEQRAGVFVSLKKEGRLRGCIGTTGPTTGSVAEEIIRNAVSAGVRDPRFDPVEVEELPFLIYSVDVLGEAVFASSMEQLDPLRYGVIVYCGGRQGLLLPNLEGVDTPEQQVSIALRKAGIGPEEPYSLSRFEVVRHRAP